MVASLHVLCTEHLHGCCDEMMHNHNVTCLQNCDNHTKESDGTAKDLNDENLHEERWIGSIREGSTRANYAHTHATAEVSETHGEASSKHGIPCTKQHSPCQLVWHTLHNTTQSMSTCMAYPAQHNPCQLVWHTLHNTTQSLSTHMAKPEQHSPCQLTKLIHNSVKLNTIPVEETGIQINFSSRQRTTGPVNLVVLPHFFIHVQTSFSELKIPL